MRAVGGLMPRAAAKPERREVVLACGGRADGRGADAALVVGAGTASQARQHWSPYDSSPIHFRVMEVARDTLGELIGGCSDVGWRDMAFTGSLRGCDGSAESATPGKRGGAIASALPDRGAPRMSLTDFHAKFFRLRAHEEMLS